MLKHVPVSRRELDFTRGGVSEETRKYFEAEIGRPLLEREARVYVHLHDCLVKNTEPNIAPEERAVIDTLLEEGHIWIVSQKVYINPDFYPVMHEVIYDAYVENVLITREEFEMHFAAGEGKSKMRIGEEPSGMPGMFQESSVLMN